MVTLYGLDTDGFYSELGRMFGICSRCRVSARWQTVTGDMFRKSAASGYEKLLHASSNIAGRCIYQVWPTGILGSWLLADSGLSVPPRFRSAALFIMLYITAIVTLSALCFTFVLAYFRRRRGSGYLKKPIRNWRTLVIKIQRIRKLQRIYHNTGMALQFYLPASKPLLTRLSYIYLKSEDCGNPSPQR